MLSRGEAGFILWKGGLKMTVRQIVVMLSLAVQTAGCTQAMMANRSVLSLSVVPAPVPTDGYVVGQATHVQFVLVADASPRIKGVGLNRGDALVILLPAAFRRNDASPIRADSDFNMVLTKGWPQAPVRQAGQYRIFYDAGMNTIEARALADVTTDGPNDPGIKTMHLRGATFINPAAGDYPVELRHLGSDGSVKTTWAGKISVLPTRMKARLAPTNFHLGPGMNGDFQIVEPNQDAPLHFGLYLWNESGEPINRVGVASPDLTRFPKYTGGLLIQDSNGDNKLDPSVDRVVGGIIGTAPPGATGQVASSPTADGKPILSGEMLRSTKFPAAAGGGKPDPGLLPIAFHSGNKPGLYRPIVELIGGNSYQFTVEVR